MFCVARCLILTCSRNQNKSLLIHLEATIIFIKSLMLLEVRGVLALQYLDWENKTKCWVSSFTIKALAHIRNFEVGWLQVEITLVTNTHLLQVKHRQLIPRNSTWTNLTLSYQTAPAWFNFIVCCRFSHIYEDGLTDEKRSAQSPVEAKLH